MIIVLFVLFAAIFAASVYIYYKWDDGFGVLAIAVSIFALGAVIASGFVMTNGVVGEHVIDDKITMYEEENASIEEAMNELVSSYMAHEKDTFAELKGDSAIALVSLYPELKSDELVKIQLETHAANVERIRDLKEQKLDISVYKWWLYFGGANK